MKRKLTYLLFALFILNNSFGQVITRDGKCGRKGPTICPKLSIFHETNYDFTRFGFNSLNIDYVLLCKPSYMLTVRGGISYMSFNKASSIGVPLELNLLIGRSSFLFEISAGFLGQDYYKNYDSITKKTKSSSLYYQAVTGRLGIRYEAPKGGLFIRLGFTPIYSLSEYAVIYPVYNRRFIPMFGAGIGYTLRR